MLAPTIICFKDTSCYIFSNFYLLEKDQKCLLGINFIYSTRKDTNNEVVNI